MPSGNLVSGFLGLPHQESSTVAIYIYIHVTISYPNELVFLCFM